MAEEVTPRFAVILLSAGRARLRKDEEWKLHGLRCSNGSEVDIRLWTRYIDEGFSSPIDRGLQAEVIGSASDISEAVTAFGQVANFLSPILSLVANAYVPPFQYELAYESTPGHRSRLFRQWFNLIESGVPQPGRVLPFAPLTEVIELYLGHDEGARIHRAWVQYQEALAAWRPGEELRAAMHLWMAVEALTKAFLRRECGQQSVTEDELCKRWDIPKNRLDGEVRLRLIFNNNSDCYRTAVSVSDGLEHMFQDFPRLQAGALSIRDDTAKYVRRAILDLLPAPQHLLDLLLAPPYDMPLQLTAGVVSMTGVLTGDGERLAAEGMEHPHLAGDYVIRDIEADGDRYELTLETNFRLSAGGDVEFKPIAFGTEVPVNTLETNVIKGQPAKG